MKEVSFWAVKDITRNDSAQDLEERNEISHYKDKLTLSLNAAYYIIIGDIDLSTD